MAQIIGIDYGSKLGGTTVVCVIDEAMKVEFFSSIKDKDADVFLEERLAKCNPSVVFIDAPLSLPLVYSNPKAGSDYFFRKCDTALRAMSPMFLGGLTARAMKLVADKKESATYAVMETYPSALCDKLDIDHTAVKSSKEELIKAIEIIKALYDIKLKKEQVKNIHFLDALLAAISGLRHSAGESIAYGDPNEGIIYI